MGNLISREQLITYFVQSSHFLNGYYENISKLKRKEVNIEAIEQMIDIHRRNKNFDELIPLLILSAHYYIHIENNQIATLYFIECHALLKEIDSNCILRLLIFLELGYVLKKDQHFKEASYYYMNALYFSIEKKLDLFIKYSMHELGVLTILSNSQKDAFDFKTLIEQQGESTLTDFGQLIFDIEQLQYYEDYEALEKIVLTALENEKLMENENIAIFIELCYCLTQYHLNKLDKIEWITESKVQEVRDDVVATYWLEYELISAYNFSPQNFTSYVQTIEERLIKNQQWYLLDFLYDKLIQYHFNEDDAQWEEQIIEKRNENKQFIFKRENKMKDRLQNIHANYKQYYLRMDSYECQTSIEKLNIESFKCQYEQHFSNQMVLGIICLNGFVYKPVTGDYVETIIQQLGERVGGQLTYCIDCSLIWFYFKSYETEMKLKQKLNRIVQHLYEILNKEIILATCLPRQCRQDFEETQEKVFACFYNTVVQNNQEEPCQFVYYRKGLQHYDISVKFKQLMLKAKQNNKIIFRENYIYQTDCHEIYGVEFSIDIIGFDSLLQIIEVKEHWVKEAAVTEMELLLVESASMYMKEHFSHTEHQPYLFIKLSRETLLNPFTVIRISEWFKKLDISHEKIVFEISEGTIFENNLILNEVISELKRAGFNIGLDDYGTGTLTGSIRNVAINYLKISDYLLNEIKRVNDKHYIMQSLRKICSERNIKLLCSNVESETSHNTILNFGINLASGVYYQ